MIQEHALSSRIRTHIRSNVVGYIALFAFAMSGTASAVDGPLAGTNTVGSSDIINEEVKTSDIGNGAVGNDKLAGNAVGSGKVRDNSLTGADVATNSLTGFDVTDNSLTGVDVTNNTLTGADVASNSLTGFDVTDNSLTGVDVTDNTLTGEDVRDLTLTGDDVKPFSLTGDRLEDNAIGTYQVSLLYSQDILDETLTRADLASGSVTSSEIASSAVDWPEIAANAVASRELANIVEVKAYASVPQGSGAHNVVLPCGGSSTVISGGFSNPSNSSVMASHKWRFGEGWEITIEKASNFGIQAEIFAYCLPF